MLQNIAMLGTLGDLYFRGINDPKTALSVREITKVVEQLGNMPADNAGRIEIAGQAFDSFEMIRESFKPLASNAYGPLATFASLLVNASITYTGSEVEGGKLIRELKAGSASQTDVTGLILSIDPDKQHITHDTVAGVVSAVTADLPWLARKALGLVDRFVEGMMGSDVNDHTQHSLDDDINRSDAGVIEQPKPSTRISQFID